MFVFHLFQLHKKEKPFVLIAVGNSPTGYWLNVTSGVVLTRQTEIEVDVIRLEKTPISPSGERSLVLSIEPSSPFGTPLSHFIRQNWKFREKKKKKKVETQPNGLFSKQEQRLN